MTNRVRSVRLWACMAAACVGLGVSGVCARAWGDPPPPNPPGSAAVVFSPEAPFSNPPREDVDKYGGWLAQKGKATGFFHMEQVGNRWWMITPEGHAYYMLAVTGAPDKEYDRCKSWGLNAIAAEPRSPEAAGKMPYTKILYFFNHGKTLPIARNAGIPPWVTFPDVFDPEWVKKCDEYAQAALAPLANDPWLIGYYIDNEPNFSGWYEVVTHLPQDAPFRKAFVEVARAYYADKPGQLAKDWKAFGASTADDLLKAEGDAPVLPELAAIWQVAVAEQAFGTIDRAAKKADPNHMNLGTRMINAVPPSPGVFVVMGKHMDVVSWNLYSLWSDRLLTQIFTLLPAIYEMTKKPILTSEFTFRGGDTRCPNTTGAPPSVPTQGDRAVGYLSYMSAVASLPFHVGVCWYKYGDDGLDLPWGRYGEDCNFGMVDGFNRPYASLVQTLRLVNGSIYELAADPVRSKECPLFYRTELMRWDLAWDAQMLMRFGQMKQPPPDPLSALLPEPRRYHQHYWVSHKSPKLTINDEGYYGWCSANMLRKLDDGQELALYCLEGFTSLPRSSWLGAGCSEPDKPFSIDSNAQMLIRRVDGQGRLRRMAIIGGSFVLEQFNQFAIRANEKVPYLDVQYDPEGKKLTITSQGSIKNVGVRDVLGWKATWNGQPVAATALPEAPSICSFAAPSP